MNFIQPSYEILHCPDGEDVLRILELAARNCYKSEDRIDHGERSPTSSGTAWVFGREPSSHKLIRQILASGHHSVIEHASITVRFICNRGVTHELVRHRLAAYSQESTRYCNYSQSKHGGGLNIIEPSYRPVIPKPTGGAEPEYDEPWNRYRRRQVWEEALQAIEKAYLELLELGEKPQEARDILPIGLKTEIIMTADLREWLHVFALRCSPKAHPQLRELMVPLREELRRRIPIVFDEESP